MIAVIFEFEVGSGQEDDYFEIAEQLRSALDDVDGFVSIERFESRTTPGKFLSLSMWRDEAAIQVWRDFPNHRTAQNRGRQDIFSHYRIRVANVIRDYAKDPE
jgi:heme-degrading monooxygenase HmoA